ncbi:MAG TPA: protein kinase [Pyrinomonadaceae bacterium]|nr:protein kinase [Pyrinomonadaceae bacterium]
MTPERWQQVKAIFNSAIQCLPEERNSFLSQACSGDDQLRSEVESLIASYEKSGEFIDEPAYQAASWLAEEKPELKVGQTVGSYRVISFICRGGMGEVYVAEDKRLNRNVALKLLPVSFTQDIDRLRRFEQEARAASALNHPNIITIYEIQQLGPTQVIATEFVEGETLRQRLARSSLSLAEALNISIQVADALSAAHKAGIIHRDIKPENVMLRPDGYIKVLDFGLAKLSEQASPGVSSEAPTAQIRTGSGLVIGTAGYMSPEQARGLPVDGRSDIFSLGATIYEMVSRRKPFEGETPSDTLVAILQTDPLPLSHVAPKVPPELVRIVSKALRKNRDERYQVVKDLLLDLKSLKEDLDFQAKLDRSVGLGRGEALDTGSQEHLQPTAESFSDTHEVKTAVSTITHSVSSAIKRHKTGAILTAMVLALAIIAGSIALYKFRNRIGVETVTSQVLGTMQITFSPGVDAFPTLSPDGKFLAYSSDKNGNFEIYIRQLKPGGGELQLTNDGNQNLHPSWSPDGQRIAYYSKNRGGIWLVSTLGGAPKQLTEFGARPAWSSDGSLIAFQSGAPTEILGRAQAGSTIWIVPWNGGAPKQLTQQGNPRGGHGSPSWSPDGKRIAFAVAEYGSSSVWSADVNGGQTRKIATGSDPVYGPDGRRIYLVIGGPALWQVQLSSSGDPIGEPTNVLGPGVESNLISAAVSADGKRIVYCATRTSSNLWSISLSPTSGEVIGSPSALIDSPSRQNQDLRFSPDGRKLAFDRWRPGTRSDVWAVDADGKNLTQVTNTPATDSQPSWFPNGDKLAFLSDRDNKQMKLWAISLATGKEEPLLDLGAGVQFAQLSPDGQRVAFHANLGGVTNVWVASVRDGQRKQLTFDDQLAGFPSWSPNGQFIAFDMRRGESDYLMVIPSGGGDPTQLTSDRGKSWPYSWSPDGDKILYSGQRDGIWNLYWISHSTKVQKQLTNYSKLNSFVRYPSWSPLGNQIVYEYAEITGNLWVMELK